MHFILACGIGIISASGIWLLLRPRTFQVIVGLSLLSYAINLFLFCAGQVKLNLPPIFDYPKLPLQDYSDPVPQSLVLTAIVIGFATIAFALVLLLVMRGLAGTDHVDAKEPKRKLTKLSKARQKDD